MKANRIADVLWDVGVRSGGAFDALTGDAWTLAWKAAEVNRPSERTRRLVRTILVARGQAKLRREDPFSGLTDDPPMP